jgi:hypothetical protein
MAEHNFAVTNIVSNSKILAHGEGRKEGRNLDRVGTVGI